MKEYSFKNELNKPVEYIKLNRLSEASEMISKLMLKNDHSSEIHNLLGVIAELSGEYDLAILHYRVACTIDQSYMPANRNLERITSFSYKPKAEDIEYGEIN